MKVSQRCGRRVRRVSPNEHLYLSLTPHFRPFLVQWVIIGKGNICAERLSKAIHEVAKRNPDCTLVPRRGWWESQDLVPQIVVKSSLKKQLLEDPNLLKQPLGAQPLSPQAEVWLDAGECSGGCHSEQESVLVFRVSHALMDGRGVLAWAREIFRAMRGEVVQTNTASLSDFDYLRKQPNPKRRPDLRPIAAPPWELKPQRWGLPGCVWTKQTYPKRVNALVARLAHSFAAEARRNGKVRSVFMVPVDLRVRSKLHFLFRNFSNPLILEIGDEHWSAVYQKVVEHFVRRDELAFSLSDRFFTLIPHWLIGRSIAIIHRFLLLFQRFFFTAAISHIGLIDKAEFTCEGFCPFDVSFAPLDVPGAALTVVVTESIESTSLWFSSAPTITNSWKKRVLDPIFET